VPAKQFDESTAASKNVDDFNRLESELQFYKKCFGNFCFFEEDFKVKHKDLNIHCKNIIGPVTRYQKNAYKFIYEDKGGEIKNREIRRDKEKKILLDKRKHPWKKSNETFNHIDPLNFKEYGTIQNKRCSYINSKNHKCEFCEAAWKVVKKKRKGQ
jgi:hypothetical protein